MKDSSGNKITYTDVSGEAAQRKAVSDLCSDCRGILQRVLDLRDGQPKWPERRFGQGDSEQDDSDQSDSEQDDSDQSDNGAMRTLPDASTLENGGKYEDSSVFLELPEDNSMPHKSVRTELRASSLQGCLMCTWLLQSLNSRSSLSNHGLAEEWLKRPATIELDSWESYLSNRCINHYRLTLRCPAPPPSTEPLRAGELMTFDVHGKLVRPSAEQPWPYKSLRGDELASLLIDVMPSSPLSESLLTALVDLGQETPSSATWKLFGIWLRTCEEDHPECRSDAANRSQQAPARLIDIQSADRILLVETSMLTGEEQTRWFKYAALSHCWGDTHEPQLNKSTATTLRQGVSLQELPRLYYDAVVLARHLQIPYIWIDSLCIIQDSVDDWRRESAKMGSIYEGSYLCIAASAAINNSAGFLHKHSADWPQPLVHGNLVVSADIDMAETNMNMSQPNWCNRMRTLSEWAVDRAPLNQRAWVLQERLFAPRILHCTADEFVWECRRGMRSESHPVLTCGGSIVKDVWRDIHQASLDLRQPSSLLDRRLPCLDRWSQVVGFFTSLGITFPQDRLPAVSAIAKQLQPVLGNYAAGLWENFMPSQLLWRHACIIECRKKKHGFRQNHSPSWSWSSLDCEAVLPKYMDEKIDNFPCAESRPFDDPLNLDAATHVKILKVNVNLSGHDVTGAVEGGRIDLTGPLFPMYRSAAFGYSPGMEAPPRPDANWGIRWDWDDFSKHGFKQGASLLRNDVVGSSKSLSGTTPRDIRTQLLMASLARSPLVSSLENYLRNHQRLLALHSPELTNMCCLPVLSTSTSIKRGEEDGFVCGLILEFAGGAVGVYRRVGYFNCPRETFDKHTKGKPDATTPLTNQWPSRLNYSPGEGFTIAIV